MFCILAGCQASTKLFTRMILSHFNFRGKGPYALAILQMRKQLRHREFK